MTRYYVVPPYVILPFFVLPFVVLPYIVLCYTTDYRAYKRILQQHDATLTYLIHANHRHDYDQNMPSSKKLLPHSKSSQNTN